MSKSCESRKAREFVEEFELADGRRIYLVAEGRLVNLSSAEGHPAAVMDMSFANQALSAEYVVNNAAGLERRVYPVPAVSGLAVPAPLRCPRPRRPGTAPAPP